MIRAYLYALDPTDTQAEAFRSYCGAQRYAYNFGFALVRANLDQRAAERIYGITDEQLTPLVVMVGLQLAPCVERHQGAAGAVVGGELEGGVLLRADQPRHRAEQLVCQQDR